MFHICPYCALVDIFSMIYLFFYLPSLMIPIFLNAKSIERIVIGCGQLSMTLILILCTGAEPSITK